MLRSGVDAAIVVVMPEIPRLGGIDPLAAACAVRETGRYLLREAPA
jgi:hypothetical protein